MSDQLLDALQAWTQHGQEPESLTEVTATGESLKVCAYPDKPLVTGHSGGAAAGRELARSNARTPTHAGRDRTMITALAAPEPLRLPGLALDRSCACKLTTSLGYAELAMAASAEKGAVDDVLASLEQARTRLVTFRHRTDSRPHAACPR